MAVLINPEQVREVSTLVAEYINFEHDRFAHLALPLSRTQTSAMAGFFSREVLESTRLIVLVGMKIENPYFYPKLCEMGFSELPDFAGMAATTFDNIVVSHEPFTDGLLFHELVHVVQFRQLGVKRFADLYVRGFLNGGGYDGIPLERNAYDLGARFETDQLTKFPVEHEVRSWIADTRF